MKKRPRRGAFARDSQLILSESILSCAIGTAGKPRKSAKIKVYTRVFGFVLPSAHQRRSWP